MIQNYDLTHLDLRDAFDVTQTDPKFGDGVVMVLQTGAVAVMVGAWPVLVTGQADGFHQLQKWQSWDTLENGKYVESVREAHLLAAADLLDEGTMDVDGPDNDHYSWSCPCGCLNYEDNDAENPTCEQCGSTPDNYKG